MSSSQTDETWYGVVARVLKANNVSLVAYIPDNVLAPLIELIHADPHFTVICPAREEEAVAIVAGAYMAGQPGRHFRVVVLRADKLHHALIRKQGLQANVEPSEMLHELPAAETRQKLNHCG